MSFFRKILIFGAGYVFGARAGRARYEQIKKQAKKLWDSSVVQKYRKKAKDTASETFQRATNAAMGSVKNAATAAVSKVKDTANDSLKSASSADTPNADEIIVEPIEDLVKSDAHE